MSYDSFRWLVAIVVWQISVGLYPTLQAQSTDYNFMTGTRVALKFASEDRLTEVRPFIAYQLHRQWLAGAEVGRSWMEQSYDSSIWSGSIIRGLGESDLSAYHAGAWIRYTINPLSRVQVFIQPFAEFEFIEGNEYFNGALFSFIDQDILYYGFELGGAVRISDRWSIVAHAFRMHVTKNITTNDHFSEGFLLDPLIDLSGQYRF